MSTNASPGDETGAAATAAFGEMVEEGGAGGALPLSMLYDLTMPVAVELGRTSLSVQRILELGRGSVIRLDRLAGEAVDVYVGERRMAEGEVVVVDDQFGVRITRLVSPPPGSESADA